jgi:hypothetical protein
MGCCNEPVSTLTGVPPDPSQHVNYARGMVLGVDDFVQEFAYLDGHTRWLAREAVGYGTVTGLRVHMENDGSNGPRLRVRAGSALMPNGKLVCVQADQCAVLNRWLAKPENAAVVARLLHPTSPPMSPPALPAPGDTGLLKLYLRLCASECLTRPVPIPGEPCRSEDQLMADSRVADDFKLELHESAPSQVEEDALRDFVRWLQGSVQTVDGSPPPPSDESTWLEALRHAAQPWLAAQDASPPPSPPASFETLRDYLFDSSPPGLQVAESDLADFLRVACRFWVTELRPMWAALRCHSAKQPDSGCVLLAQVRVNVKWVDGSPSGVWQVMGNASSVTLDESQRPILMPTRLLQEWVLARGAVSGIAAGGTGLNTPPSDGQLLIGSGGAYALGSLQGTANQVRVTSNAGSITLSTPQDIAFRSRPQFDGLRTTGAVHVATTATAVDLALDATHHFLICDGGPSVQLPKAAPDNLGRIYVVKSISGDSKVLPDAGDTIDGPTATPGLVKKGNAKTFASDGGKTWHVIATVA